MTKLFGYYQRDQDTDRRQFLESLAHRQTADSTVSAGSVSCAAPYTLNHDNTVLAIKGEPAWNGTQLNSENHSQILKDILNQYRKVGNAFLAQMQGPFALAIVDPAGPSCILAIDRIGIERMTYGSSGNTFAFGTDATIVSDSLYSSRKVRNQALYDFLFMHMVPGPDTVFEGVSKLPPASYLEYRDGHINVQRYWTPTYNYQSKKDFPELKEALFDGLRNGVAAASPTAESGAFLSGGLDSSTVAGVFSAVREGPVKTFTVGFDVAEFDERKYSRIAAKQFGCESFEYEMKPADIVNALGKIATSYDEPFGNSSALPVYFCAEFAKSNGINHLLAGDGGDELFGGNERYIRQQVFSWYDHLPSLLQNSVLNPLSKIVSEESRITPLRKLKSYVDQSKIPLPERFETWNFVYREGRHTMLDPEFAASIDPDGPFTLMREVWNSATSENLLEKMLWYDWRFTLAENDLRKVGAMCELAGVRVSFPMLHQDLIDLSGRIPPTMKIRNMNLRDFYKKSVKNFLPDEIINKTKHGFGLPFGNWLKTDQHLADLVYSLLTDFKKRHVVKAQFIDELISAHTSGHPGYYGYVIWDIAMLEAWLAHNTH